MLASCVALRGYMLSNQKDEPAQWQNLNQQKLKQLLLENVIQEGLLQARQSAHQAHWSFLSSIALSTTSAAISLTGALFLLLGGVSEGTVTTAVGLASGVYSHQLSKDAAERQRQASDRLNRLLEHLYMMKSDS